LRLGGAGAFPSASRPRVLWLGLESPGRGVFVLQERLRSAVAPFTHSPEDRLFTPHLTLGRVKRLFPIEAEGIRHRMASPPRSAWESWTARSVNLMQSHLESQGSVHQCLCAVDLLGGTHSGTAGRLDEDVR
jgi:2'-5' RNA ligase